MSLLGGVIDRHSWDPSLIGCDDIPEAEHFDPPLMRSRSKLLDPVLRQAQDTGSRDPGPSTGSGHGQS
jgi:hypothetical protein